jgi:glycosyltransferase involved in cell wall biosynthesis
MSDTIAFVTPRYGMETVGGAEAHARMLAEELHRTGTSVEVLTTCTNDMIVWNNAYPPGRTIINGVPVRRFPSDAVDIDAYHQVVAKAFADPHSVTYGEQQLMLRNSIHSQPLYDYLREHADRLRCCIVMPYLFGTTFGAARIMGDKTIHIPCMHDEPFAYFAIFREMLEEAGGILFNTPEELQLARRLGIFNPAAAVVGCGFHQPPPTNPHSFRQRYQLGDDPFVLYSGRFDIAKNVPLLFDYFLRYKHEHATPLRLALMGQGPVAPPEHPGIVRLGFLPAEEINAAFAAADALVQLSKQESLSLVLLEAWLLGRPAIVHSQCAVTRGHVERSAGGWAIGSYEEFAAALDELQADPAQAAQRGRAGQAYVQREYSWEQVLQRFHDAVGRFTAPRSLYQTISQRGRRRALEFTEQRYAEHFRRTIEQAARPARAAQAYAELLEPLRDLGQVTRPDYRVRSSAPVVGGLIAWLRRNLTSHLREPYLDPILAQQERFNQAIQAQLAELARLVWRADQQESLRKQVEAQQAQLAELRARIAELERTSGEEEGKPPD